MIHKIEDVGRIIAEILRANREKGQLCTIVVKDDGRKVRVGNRKTTVILQESVEWK